MAGSGRDEPVHDTTVYEANRIAFVTITAVGLVLIGFAIGVATELISESHPLLTDSGIFRYWGIWLIVGLLLTISALRTLRMRRPYELCEYWFIMRPDIFFRTIVVDRIDVHAVRERGPFLVFQADRTVVLVKWAMRDYAAFRRDLASRWLQASHLFLPRV